MKPESEAESIQRLLKAIRDKRTERVSHLHTEANRLVDWKEYVRMAPIASLIGSAAAGFLVVNALSQSKASPAALPNEVKTAKAGIAKSTTIQWLGSLVLPMVTIAAKKYLAESLSKVIQGNSNESESATHPIPEQRAYAERTQFEHH